MDNRTKSFQLSLIVVTLLIAAALTQVVSAQTYKVDSGFAAGVADASTRNYVSAIQADGKIITGGSFGFADGVVRPNIARFNPDGTLDNSFNPGGIGPSAEVLEIKALSNGKILIGGAFLLQ